MERTALPATGAGTRRLSPGCCAAYTLVEVMIAVFLLAILTLAIFGALGAGLGTVQSSRENIRATQIMMQKMETIRLFTWQQGTNATLAPTTFVAYYDPLATNAQETGVKYHGRITVQPSPTNVLTALRPTVRLVTVTLTWTNYPSAQKRIVHQRQMQTLSARHGMQNYVF